MKRITLPMPDTTVDGARLVQVALVNWFPPLTDSEHFENAVSVAAGFDPPHPEPNIVEVVWERPSAEDLQVYRAALEALVETDDYGVELGWASDE